MPDLSKEPSLSQPRPTRRISDNESEEKLDEKFSDLEETSRDSPQHENGVDEAALAPVVMPWKYKVYLMIHGPAESYSRIPLITCIVAQWVALLVIVMLPIGNTWADSSMSPLKVSECKNLIRSWSAVVRAPFLLYALTVK